MKKTLKAFAVTAAFLAAGACAFAETSVNAYNKISSGIVNITSPKDGDTTTKFDGIKNKSHVELTSDRVDGLIEITTSLTAGSYSGTSIAGVTITDSTGYFGLTQSVSDYYIEFRPIDLVTIGFHDGIPTAGAYLPYYDDSLSAGNMGSDLVLCLRPIEGLRISGGVDLPLKVFTADSYKDSNVVDANFGIDYAYNDFGAFGVAVRNVAAKTTDSNGNKVWDGTLGVYASLTEFADKGLSFVNVGFALNADNDVGVDGNILSVGSCYTNGALTVALDFVTNFEAEGDKDLYFALCPTYGLTDAITLGFGFSTLASYAEDSNASLNFYPFVDYVIGNNKFEAGVNVAITTNTETSVSIPVYWKYTF